MSAPPDSPGPAALMGPGWLPTAHELTWADSSSQEAAQQLKKMKLPSSLSPQGQGQQLRAPVEQEGQCCLC